MNNYEELIDKIDKTAAAFSNHLGDNNMSDFLKEPIEAIKQLVAERDELVAGITRMIGRFDRFEVPFTLAELRRQVAALAKVGADKTGEK